MDKPESYSAEQLETMSKPVAEKYGTSEKFRDLIVGIKRLADQAFEKEKRATVIDLDPEREKKVSKGRKRVSKAIDTLRKESLALMNSV